MIREELVIIMKNIAPDLDGTLLRSDKSISDFSLYKQLLFHNFIFYVRKTVGIQFDLGIY
jgi:hypothetical protein